jgi:hypothetical protein
MCLARHPALDAHVLFMFVGKAAEQASTNPADLRRVQREVLILRHFNRHARVVGKECGAAEQATAWTDAAQEFCLVARTDLAEFDAGAKRARQIAHQGAEIDAFFSGEVEGQSRAVERILGFDQAHRQSVFLDFFGAAGEQFVLMTVQLAQTLEIDRFCAAEDRFQFTDDLFWIDQSRWIGDLCKFRAAYRFDNHVVALG